MNNKRLFVAVGLTVLLGLTVFPMIQGMSAASEVRIIRLYADTIDGKKEIYIEPNTSWVPKDTVIIWVNQARIDEVKVVFEEGKRCADVTSSPEGFNMDAACFVTSWVPSGGTSSLKFVEAGIFKYMVETSDGVKAKGKIIVGQK
jgi:hypothetical protein